MTYILNYLNYTCSAMRMFSHIYLNNISVFIFQYVSSDLS